MRLFKRSNTFLAVVFCALAMDSALALPNATRALNGRVRIEASQ